MTTALTGRQAPPAETVMGQLTGRYQLKRIWPRYAWHLSSRWLRKLLSHILPSTCASELVLARSVRRSHHR